MLLPLLCFVFVFSLLLLFFNPLFALFLLLLFLGNFFIQHFHTFALHSRLMHSFVRAAAANNATHHACQKWWLANNNINTHTSSHSHTQTDSWWSYRSFSQSLKLFIRQISLWMRSACVHDGVSEITEAAIKLFELPLPLSTATERVRATTSSCARVCLCGCWCACAWERRRMLRDARALFVCTKCICFAFELSECQRELQSVARLQFLQQMEWKSAIF